LAILSSVPDDLPMRSLGRDTQQLRMTLEDDASPVAVATAPANIERSMRSRSFDPINATGSRQLRISGS